MSNRSFHALPLPRAVSPQRGARALLGMMLLLGLIHCRKDSDAAPQAASVPAGAPEPPAPPPLQGEVVPFDPALVMHWPGLPNVGNSCFINSTLKVLAAVPEIDPLLRHRADDEPARARLRDRMRAMINFIRSGGARTLPDAPDARTQVRALFHACAAFPGLQGFTGNARLRGGDDCRFQSELLKALGQEHLLRLDLTTRESPAHDLGPFTYSEGERVHFITLNPRTAGHDLASVHDLASYLTRDFEQAAIHPDAVGRITAQRNLPTRVPPVFRLMFLHAPPVKALAFSPRVPIPVYAVDRTAHTEHRVGTVQVEPCAMVMGNDRHVFALIRGREGWYRNDDATPPRLVATRDLDERIGEDGTLLLEFSSILLRRVEP